MRYHDFTCHKPKPPPGASLFDFPVVERVGKCVRLLASPVNGEVVAAARAPQRTLTESGRDLHFLADIIADGWRDPKPIIVDIKPKKRPDWQILAAEILRDHEHDPAIVWGSKEQDFLQNMARSRYAPTAGQWKWLKDIAARRSQSQLQAGGRP